MLCRNANWVERNPERRKAHTKKFNDTHADALRWYALKKNYGITKERYEQMMAEQDHRCRMCHEPFGEKGLRPHVDHDHVTGRVRGIIHHRCNQGLAWVEDEAFRKSALAYLENSDVVAAG